MTKYTENHEARLIRLQELLTLWTFTWIHGYENYEDAVEKEESLKPLKRYIFQNPACQYSVDFGKPPVHHPVDCSTCAVMKWRKTGCYEGGLRKWLDADNAESRKAAALEIMNLIIDEIHELKRTYGLK